MKIGTYLDMALGTQDADSACLAVTTNSLVWSMSRHVPDSVQIYVKQNSP